MAVSNESWMEDMQKAVTSHQDLEILSTSACGKVVSSTASSILLSAYSDALRKAFNMEEESSVILCQDFSHECIEKVLHFLTFGEAQSCTDDGIADLF